MSQTIGWKEAARPADGEGELRLGADRLHRCGRGTRRAWRLVVDGYWYYLLEPRTEGELLAFHWPPPNGPARAEARLNEAPHLHLDSRILAPGWWEFATRHLPSRHILLEDFMLFVIRE